MALLEPTGLDWSTSLGELADRHGVLNHEDFGAVVQLPPLTTFTQVPLQFLIRYHSHTRDIIPSYAFCYLALADTAERSHAALISQIQSSLGQGISGGPGNTLQAEWRFGEISLTVTTWPPELQRDSLPNALYDRNPGLRSASLISLRTPRGHIFPSRELEGLLDDPSTQLFRSAAAPHGIFTIPLEIAGYAPRILSARYERTNPPELVQRLGEHHWCIWRNDTQQTLGITTAARTLLLPRSHCASLQHIRSLPGRGPGGAELAAIEHPAVQIADYARGTVPLLTGRTPEILDLLSSEVPHFLHLPCTRFDQPA